MASALARTCPYAAFSATLAELQSVCGQLGLPVERDRHFEAEKTISAYAAEARTAVRIVT